MPLVSISASAESPDIARSDERRIEFLAFIDNCQCAIAETELTEWIPRQTISTLIDRIPSTRTYAERAMLGIALLRVVANPALGSTDAVALRLTRTSIATGFDVHVLARELQSTVAENNSNNQDKPANYHTNALEVIRAEYHNQGMTLQTVAKSIGISPSHLAHQLKRATGSGFIFHLHQHRIAAARVQLLATTKSIKEIAYDVGYSRTADLDRWFKRLLNTTPSDFRYHTIHFA